MSLLMWVSVFVAALNGAPGVPASNTVGGPLTQDESDQLFPLGGDYAASHIVVAYKGADKAPDTVTRTKSQAQQRAEELLQEVLRNPAQFEDMAKSESDGVTAELGGNLGAFQKGEMDRSFEYAVKALEVGEITSKLVKTPFGFHIIRRNPMEVKRYGARVLLLSHDQLPAVTGFKENAEGVSRSLSETQKLVEELKGALTPENFAKKAQKHSDLDKVFVGVFKTGDDVFTDRVIEQVKTLAYNEITGPLEWSIGYVFLQRVKVERRAGARIFVGHMDGSQDEIFRSRKEAQELIEKLHKQLQEKPENFARLAKKYSDDPGAVGGGIIPAWYVGYQPVELEAAFAGLQEGQLSEPIETSEGFFILRRDPLASKK